MARGEGTPSRTRAPGLRVSTPAWPRRGSNNPGSPEGVGLSPKRRGTHPHLHTAGNYPGMTGRVPAVDGHELGAKTGCVAASARPWAPERVWTANREGGEAGGPEREPADGSHTEPATHPPTPLPDRRLVVWTLPPRAAVADRSCAGAPRDAEFPTHAATLATPQRPTRPTTNRPTPHTGVPPASRAAPPASGQRPRLSRLGIVPRTTCPLFVAHEHISKTTAAAGPSKDKVESMSWGMGQGRLPAHLSALQVAPPTDR